MRNPGSTRTALSRDLAGDDLRVIERAAVFADEVVAPRSSAWEAGTDEPAAVLGQSASAGLLGLLVPREQGGLGLRPSVMAAVAEAMAARDFFFTFALVVHNNLPRSRLTALNRNATGICLL